MSEVKTDKLSPRTGSGTVTLGTSGDTFTVPSGVTIANSGTATGFGGITYASQWRLTTDFTGSSEPIAANLEAVDAPLGFGSIGSAMTQASGIFTFPQTGYWYVEAYADWTDATSSSLGRSRIYISTTTNNSTYAVASNGWGGTYYSRNTGTCSYIMDVTDVTQCKVKFSVSQAGGTVVTNGDTDFNDTFFTFIRLSDT